MLYKVNLCKFSTLKNTTIKPIYGRKEWSGNLLWKRLLVNTFRAETKIKCLIWPALERRLTQIYCYHESGNNKRIQKQNEVIKDTRIESKSSWPCATEQIPTILQVEPCKLSVHQKTGKLKMGTQRLSHQFMVAVNFQLEAKKCIQIDDIALCTAQMTCRMSCKEWNNLSKMSWYGWRFSVEEGKIILLELQI